MRIVLDTNVLISGTFWNGLSMRILGLIESGNHELIISSDIVEEYRRVIMYKELADKIRHFEERKLAINKIINLGIMVHPKNKLKVVLDDPDDDKFVEAAVAGNAKCIISQDKHILKLLRYNDIKIQTPQQFLEEN